MSSEHNLSGKTALLTGALGTLGRAQASVLAGAGADVLLTDLASTNGQAFAAELDASAAGSVRFIPHDLDDLAVSEAFATRLAEEHGGIDILINNAALIINRPFEEFSLAEYEDQIRVNSSAAFALVRGVAPSMKAKGYGKIVNLCSITLRGVLDGYVPYVASKGAIYGLTTALARELGPHGIRVNCISPGAIRSEAEDRVFADRLQEYNDWVLERQCLKVRGQPEDIANLSLFLCSPSSDFITGENIGIDGGW